MSVYYEIESPGNYVPGQLVCPGLCFSLRLARGLAMIPR